MEFREWLENFSVVTISKQTILPKPEDVMVNLESDPPSAVVVGKGADKDEAYKDAISKVIDEVGEEFKPCHATLMDKQTDRDTLVLTYKIYLKRCDGQF